MERTTSQPLITQRQLRLLDLAQEIEETQQDRYQGVYASRLMAQLSLPHSDPGELTEWTRRNNALTLTITPGIVTTPEGRTRAYPYGVIPRYLMTWMTTEAVRTQSRELHLGDSLRGFMNAVGLHGNGRDAKRLQDQLQRLSVASINIEDQRKDGNKWGISGANFFVTSRYDLNFGDNGNTLHGQTSTITLSEEFYANAIKAPVKLRPEVLKALSRSPLRLDLYTWFMYRLNALSRPTTITWNQLAAQFGAEYAHLRQFKAKFLKHLNEVQYFLPHGSRSFTVLPKTGLRLNKVKGTQAIAS